MIPDTANTHRPIVIVGFMGSGKTTVARELARQLSRRAMDLDQIISAREGRTSGEIIEQSGEIAFRQIETECLRQILSEASNESPPGVIALGGGAWTIPENRKLIAQSGSLTVWLDVPFALCWQRIEASGELRPLAPARESAQRLYDERRPIYELADIHVAPAAALNPNETARSIVLLAFQ